MTNGELLDAAERDGFAVLVTTDTSLEYQQNLESRRLVLVLLLSTSWPRIQRVTDRVIAAIERAVPGSCIEVEIP